MSLSINEQVFHQRQIEFGRKRTVQEWRRIRISMEFRRNPNRVEHFLYFISSKKLVTKETELGDVIRPSLGRIWFAM